MADQDLNYGGIGEALGALLGLGIRGFVPQESRAKFGLLDPEEHKEVFLKKQKQAELEYQEGFLRRKGTIEAEQKQAEVPGLLSMLETIDPELALQFRQPAVQAPVETEQQALTGLPTIGATTAIPGPYRKDIPHAGITKILGEATEKKYAKPVAGQRPTVMSMIEEEMPAGTPTAKLDRYAQVQGGIAGARRENVIAENLQEPATQEEVRDLYTRADLKPVKAGMTKGDLRKIDTVKVSPKDRGNYATLTSGVVPTFLTTLDGLSGKLFKAKPGFETTAQWLSAKASGLQLTQWQRDFRNFDSVKRQFVASMRQLTGDVGVFTDVDAERLFGGFPNEGDTAEVAAKKMAIVKQLYKGVVASHRKALTGDLNFEDWEDTKAKMMEALDAASKKAAKGAAGGGLPEGVKVTIQ
mgnify:CR=1 FL=1